VDPEARKPRLLQDSDSGVACVTRSPPKVGDIRHGDADRLRLGGVLVTRSEAYGHDVFVAHQRPQPLRAGQICHATACHQSKVFAGSGPNRATVAGMAELKVAIDERQPIAAHPSQGEHVSQQDAADAS
jgi:hypothetical protein